jgi:virginiamycin B lyase
MLMRRHLRSATALNFIWCLSLLPLSVVAAQRPMSELKPIFNLPVGKLSSWVEVTPAAVWVASEQPNAIHRIDPKTNKKVADIALPGDPCAGLAAGLGDLWVPLCGKPAALAKINLRSNKIEAVFAVGPAAPEGGIATSADSVWMVTDNNGSLARIDPHSGMVRQVVQIPADSFNPVYSDGQIWITHTTGSEITSVDARSGKVTATIPTGKAPRFITAGAGAVWTLNADDATVSRIDVKSRAVTQTIALNMNARGGDMKFGDGLVWVSVQNVPLTAISPASNGVVCQWAGAGGDSLGVGLGSVWLSDYREGSIERLDVAEALRACKAA